MLNLSVRVMKLVSSKKFCMLKLFIKQDILIFYVDGTTLIVNGVTAI